MSDICSTVYQVTPLVQHQEKHHTVVALLSTPWPLALHISLGIASQYPKPELQPELKPELLLFEDLFVEVHPKNIKQSKIDCHFDPLHTCSPRRQEQV